jgi:hypothetical protein
LLKGLVEGADGRRLTPAWTRKGAGQLYRYYIHTRENKEYAGASGPPRLPAIELEGNVMESGKSYALWISKPGWPRP